jgi:hypothetical protein
MVHILPTLADAVLLVRELREYNPTLRVSVVRRRARWTVKEMQ